MSHPTVASAIGRRAVLAAASAVVAGAATTSRARAQTRPPAPASFVLVHGSWHGGWCWTRVAAALVKDGHRVFTPTLTGLGERSHLMSDSITLTTHISDVVNVVKWEDLRGIVLCGHSYAGMVITGVAEQIEDRIASIVYLDAYIPADGQSMGEISTRPHAPGPSTPAPPAASFQVNEKDRAWVDGKLTPQPNGVYAEKLRVSGAYQRIAKRAYARTSVYNSPSFKANYDLCRAAGWKTYEIPSGHDAMIDRPGDVVRMLRSSI